MQCRPTVLTRESLKRGNLPYYFGFGTGGMEFALLALCDRVVGGLRNFDQAHSA